MRLRCGVNKGLDTTCSSCGSGERLQQSLVGAAIVDDDILAFGKPKLAQLGYEDLIARSRNRIVRAWTQNADAPQALRLLRARHERPRGRAAEKRYELSPLHSITSSASASSVGGNSSPSASAVCKLITNSNLLACRIGKSAGFSPLRTRPV